MSAVVKGQNKVTTGVISFRAGTRLTFSRKSGNEIRSQQIDDICYIYVEERNTTSDKVYYEALSLTTSVSAMGETAEQAYSNLIYILLQKLVTALKYPDTKIDSKVSEEIESKSKAGTRMPRDRQMRSLIRAINEFIENSDNSDSVYLTKIEEFITTDKLDDTIIDDMIIVDFEEGKKEVQTTESL